MSQKSGARFTEKQGHYLAFIHTYSYMIGQPPAEADIQRHFRVSPPSVHQMIVALERNPTSTRRPQKHRNPRATGKLADPRMARYQNVKITVTNHYTRQKQSTSRRLR
jgi:Mn-dependent DtxR family transcriptional regulator